jgi:hypothetical protein
MTRDEADSLNFMRALQWAGLGTLFLPISPFAVTLQLGSWIASKHLQTLGAKEEMRNPDAPPRPPLFGPSRYPVRERTAVTETLEQTGALLSFYSMLDFWTTPY